MDKQMEYLQLLQERNRLKKMMNTKTKEEMAKEELERGFNTHFRAAAAAKVDKTTPVVVVNHNTKLAPTNETVKRQWGKVDNNVTKRGAPIETDHYEDYSLDSEMEHPSVVTADSMLPTYGSTLESHASLDDTAVLASKISSMDKDRKQRLLEILQRDLMESEAPSGPGIVESPRPPMRQDSVEEHVIEATDDSPIRTLPSEESPRFEAKYEETPQKALCLPPIQINLKIRIYTTWQKEKFASFSALRVRLALKDDFVDLLSALKFRFLSGLMQLSNNSETVRNVNFLTGVNARYPADKQPLVSASNASGGEWKVAISAENPVDFIAEGSLSGALMDQISQQYGSVESALEAITLSLWNCSDPPPRSLNTSPIKDVDVYVNNKICWSGEVPVAVKSTGKASEESEIPPSLTVKLYGEKMKSSSAAAVTAVPAVTTVPAVAKQFSEATVDSKSSHSKAADMSTVQKSYSLGASSNLFVDTANDFAKPDWLMNPTNGPIRATGSPLRKMHSVNDAGAAGRSPAASAALNKAISWSPAKEPKRVGSASRRSRNVETTPTSADLPAPTVVASTQNIEFGSPDKASELLTPMNSSVKKKPGRRNRNGATPTGVGSLEQRFNNELGGSSSQANLTPLEEDSNLRQSMNAVQMAEKFNLGRLDAKKSPAMDRTSRFNKLSDHVNETVSGLSQIVSVPSLASLAISAPIAAAVAATAAPGDKGCISGTTLTVEIFSTWGDANYVGLNGIALYDSAGILLKHTDVNSPYEGVSANCEYLKAETGVLVEDPRKVTNLLNGQNFTRNDLHVWLCPQLPTEGDTDGSGAVIGVVTVKFVRPTSLSMVRLFNYNKSRTHNQRGVKDCRVSLDGRVLFEGQLKKCTGRLLSADTESDIIYQSEDPSLAEVLKRIVHEAETADDDPLEESTNLALARPRTATQQDPEPVNAGISNNNYNNAIGGSSSTVSVSQYDSPDKPAAAATDLFPVEDASFSGFGGAPDILSESNSYLAQLNKFTRHDKPIPVVITEEPPSTIGQGKAGGATGGLGADRNKSQGALAAPCKVLRLEIETTWGNPEYVGLCGIEVLSDANNAPIKIRTEDIDAYPRDLSAVGCFDDPRKLENLLNGNNDTADDNKMWLIPYTRKAPHWIQIKLPADSFVTGLRIWNYNKSSEDVLRGAKDVKILLDGKYICNCVFRIGPGTDGVKFGQTILFDDLFSRTNPYNEVKLITPQVRQDYDVQCNPTGLLWKFTLYDNWNDEFYIGLDCLELFDKSGALMDLYKCGAQISAVPHSVQDLGLAQGDGANALAKDPRVPSCLFASSGQGKCWLSPLSRCMTPQERVSCVKRTYQEMQTRQEGKLGPLSLSNLNFPKDNSVYLSFQHPVTVSAIRLFNYSKTPSRGVRNFSIELDGQLLYIGSLLPADREKKAPGFGRAATELSRGQSIVFSADPKVLQAHRDTVSYCGATEQDVLCINERQVMVRANHMYDDAPNVALEGIEADLSKRPGTSFHHSR